MKKSLLLIAALFAFTFAHAQGFKFGLKAGTNYSNLMGPDKDKTGIYYTDNGVQKAYFGEADYKWGYHAGITTLYELDSDGFLGIKTDLLYTTKGFQINGTQGDTDPANFGGKEDFEVKRSLNYLSLPILLNINAGGLFFELGPELAYMTNSNSEIKSTFYNAKGDKIDKTKNETQSAKEDLASFDIGYVAGIGYMSDMGLGISLRYNGGAKTIFDTKNVGRSNEVNARNNNFTASVFYMLGGK